jgi:hypothetical protein
MRWFVHRVLLVLALVGLTLGAVYYFVLLQPVEFIGILQPRAAVAQARGLGPEYWHVKLGMSGESVRLLHRALDPARGKEALDVQLLISSDPTRVFMGKLSRDQIRLEDASASVRIHPVNGDIPAEHVVPVSLLNISDVMVRVRVHVR